MPPMKGSHWLYLIGLRMNTHVVDLEERKVASMPRPGGRATLMITDDH